MNNEVRPNPAPLFANQWKDSEIIAGISAKAKTRMIEVLSLNTFYNFTLLQKKYSNIFESEN